MQTTQKNRGIGERAAQQRLVSNAAIEHALAHPDVTKNQLQGRLTRWRNQGPKR